LSRAPDFRLGIVGLGGIAVNAHGPASRRCPEISLAACCDVRKEAADSWAGEYGGTAYTDYRRMLSAEHLDGVLLATWPNQHREQIEGCLDAGVKNILCEKALTLGGPDAVEIYEMVIAAGAFLMEGFMYRHSPVMRKLEQLLAQEELGPVDSVRACFSAFDSEDADSEDPGRNWRQRRECGGGIPYDFACYCVNCCGHFAHSLPKRAYCIGTTGKYDTLNRMHGTIEYENGIVGIIESSKKCSFTQELQIACAGGILDLPNAWTPDRNVTISQRHTDWNNATYDTHAVDGLTDGTQPYELQLRNFVASAQGQSEPAIPLAQSVVNTFALEALVTSASQEQVVDITIPQAIADAHRAQMHATSPG